MPNSVFSLSLALASTPAAAGIADSPLPELLAGETAYHVYSVPGVVAGFGLGSFFSCTSTGDAPMQVGVELFAGTGGPNANDAVATSLVVNPGATVTFGTSFAGGFGVHSNVGGLLSVGSARILSTSKKLVCTAFMADVVNAPPTSMVSLTIIAKTKQKAAN